MLGTLKKPLPKYDSTTRTLAALSRAGEVIAMNDDRYIDDQVAAVMPAVGEKGKAESDEASLIRVETPVLKMGGLG